MRENPICPCGEEVGSSDLVYEAPCGHENCISLAWHPICLMRHRDERENHEKKREESEREEMREMKRILALMENLFRPPSEN